MGHIWIDILTQNQCSLIEQNRQPKNNTHTALVYGMYMMKLVVLICLVFLKKSWRMSSAALVSSTTMSATFCLKDEINLKI